MSDTRQVAFLSLAIILLGLAAAARAQQFEVPIVARSTIINGTNDHRQQNDPPRQSTPASRLEARVYSSDLASKRARHLSRVFGGSPSHWGSGYRAEPIDHAAGTVRPLACASTQGSDRVVPCLSCAPPLTVFSGKGTGRISFRRTPDIGARFQTARNGEERRGGAKLPLTCQHHFKERAS